MSLVELQLIANTFTDALGGTLEQWFKAAPTLMIPLFGAVWVCGIFVFLGHMATLTTWTVENGGVVLDHVVKYTPNPFSFPMPSMSMMAMATTEHRSEGQRGFSQTRDTGGGDDDNGNADGNQDRDQPHQQGQKLSWDEILAKLQQLKAEFLVIKTGDTHAETDKT